MRTNNLTAPRYQGIIDISDRGNMMLIRLGIIRLSPGQWVTTGDGDKARFVRIDAANNLWLVHGTSTRKFRLACKASIG